MDTFDFDEDLLVEEEIRLEKPKMYKILLHNDHYTLREFVVLVLEIVFRKTMEEARRIMLEAHTKGVSVVGIYTYEIASTCIRQVEKLSEEYDCALRCTMEAVEI